MCGIHAGGGGEGSGRGDQMFLQHLLCARPCAQCKKTNQARFSPPYHTLHKAVGVRDMCAASITYTHTHAYARTQGTSTHTYMEKTYLDDSLLSGPCQVSKRISPNRKQAVALEDPQGNSQAAPSSPPAASWRPASHPETNPFKWLLFLPTKAPNSFLPSETLRI